MRFLFVDTETTGLPTVDDYKVLQCFDYARLTELAFTVHSTGPIPDRTVNFTHLTAETRVEALTAFVDALDRDILVVGHNTPFDLQIIKSELYRLNNMAAVATVEQRPFACTMRLAAPHFGKWPRLAVLYQHFFGHEPPIVHHALPDVITTVNCWYAMWHMGWLPELPPPPLFVQFPAAPVDPVNPQDPQDPVTEPPTALVATALEAPPAAHQPSVSAA